MTCELWHIAPLPCCATSLKIGKFASAKSNVYATFINLITNNQVTKQFSTDGSGNIIIDVTDISFPTDQPYQIQFSTAAFGYYGEEEFTVGSSDPMTYVRTKFEAMKNPDGSEFEVLQGVARMI